MPYSLPPLPYDYDALEPFIDTKTMEVHHDKHHQTYVDKLNAVLAKHPELEAVPLEKLLATVKTLPISDVDKIAIRNHGGGHANHSLFWQVMGPQKSVDHELVTDIEKKWGSLADFKKIFSDMAVGLFGSGWVWLSRGANNELHLEALPNQDTPLRLGRFPIFCLDVWEHAYYLKYQNRRSEYIQAWWNVLRLLP